MFNFKIYNIILSYKIYNILNFSENNMSDPKMIIRIAFIFWGSRKTSQGFLELFLI